jgi:peptide chain release factor 2
MNKELLFSITKKDLELCFFSGHGAGGQNRNRHMNCVRLKHKDSGVIVTGQSYKEQRYNIKEALNNLVKHPKFKMWHTQKVNEILSGQTLGQKVDEMMLPENIRIEIQDEEGRWILDDEKSKKNNL